LALTSDGTGVDTLGTTGLTAQTISASATLFAYATADLGASVFDFGQHHVGDTLTQALALSNTAAAGTSSENLDASFSATSGSLTGSGNVALLAAGATDTSDLTVGLNSAIAGAVTGGATLDLTSDGTGVDTLGSTGLTAQTIAASATLFAYATADLGQTAIDFGIVHVGQSVTQALTLSNTAAAGGFSENLDANFAAATSNITDVGSVTGLAAQSSTSDLSVGLDTTTATVINGSATVALTSDGAGIDTLEAMALDPQTVTVTGTVDNYATASIAVLSGQTLTGVATDETIDLGTLQQGSGTTAITLDVQNSASGQADQLGGSFDVAAAVGFSTSGFASFSTLDAGLSTGSDTITLSTDNTGTFTETVTLDATGSNASGYSHGLTAETLTVTGDVAPCFAAGTHITTQRGDVAVEALQVGDRVVTVLDERAAREVIWLGHRTIDCRRHPRPHDVWPVRVAAHAFGPNMPRRTLLLSPDHAVFTGGVLIAVRYLVNGASIVQIEVDRVTYWHVELAEHDVLLAEGLPCESYLDTGNRCAFANGGTLVQAYPNFARATWQAKGCAPLVLEGPRLVRTRDRLIARLHQLGYDVTNTPDLRIAADDCKLDPDWDGDTCYVTLPDGTARITLRSNRARPADLDAGSKDTRLLGVALISLRIDRDDIALDDPRLSAGWLAPEDDLRWSDGAGVIDVSGASMVKMRFGRWLRYIAGQRAAA
jgi:hypothetical protein